jgi:hypothetical protein
MAKRICKKTSDTGAYNLLNASNCTVVSGITQLPISKTPYSN